MNKIIKEAANPDELIKYLGMLDQLYPDKAEIKARLGLAYLMSGKIDSADAYLRAAEKKIGVFAKRDAKYLTFAGLTDINLKSGNFDKAVRFAAKALSTKSEDLLGVRVLLARANVASGQYADAYEAYQIARGPLRRFMNATDYDFIISMQVDNKEWSLARDAYLEKMMALGYAPGDGLGLSLIYEKHGDYSRSLSAAAFELWRLHDEGKLSTDDAIKRLDEVVGKVWASLDDSSKSRFDETARGYKLIFQDKWGEAVDLLGKDVNDTRDCFEVYSICVAASLSAQGHSLESLRNLIALEPYFLKYQPYYYNIWRAVKNSSGAYSFDGMRPIFEKTVSLGYDTPLATLTKAEMARLLGLSGGDADRLIPPNGVEELIARYYASGDASFLRPIGELLSLPNNLYTSECIRILERFSKDQTLAKTLLSSSGRRTTLLELRIGDVFGRLQE